MTLTEAAAFSNAAQRARRDLEVAMARMRIEMDRINRYRIARGVAPLDFAAEVNSVRRESANG